MGNDFIPVHSSANALDVVKSIVDVLNSKTINHCPPLLCFVVRSERGSEKILRLNLDETSIGAFGLTAEEVPLEHSRIGRRVLAFLIAIPTENPPIEGQGTVGILDWYLQPADITDLVDSQKSLIVRHL